MEESSFQKRRLLSWGCLISITFLMLGCSIMLSPLSEAPCPIDSLLIEATSLPEIIFQETGGRSSEDAPARVGIEKAGTTFASFDKGGIVNHVYRFEKAEEALQEFQHVSRYSFSQTKDITEWVEPGKLIDIDLHADAYKAACSLIINVEPNVEVCKFVAQYGPYETDLTVDMIALDHSDFVNLIVDIDQKMSVCLDRNNQ
jgi:hypothetical protein